MKDPRFTHNPPPRDDNEVNFDLERMRAAVEGGYRVVPTGLTPEELDEWILQEGRAHGDHS